MSNVIVQKIKSALSLDKKDVVDVELKINGKPAMEALNEIETKMESISKRAGSYDKGYGAPADGNDPEHSPNPTGNPTEYSDAVPGVPGTSKGQPKTPKGGKGPTDVPPLGKKVNETAEEEDEGKKMDEAGLTSEDLDEIKELEDEDDMEECTCAQCGSKYKAKKAEKVDEVKPADEEEKPEKEAYDDKYVAPKAEKDKEEDTTKKMTSLSTDFIAGQRISLAKPTKKELDEIKTKSFKKEQSEIFGKHIKTSTPNAKMSQWAMEQFLPKSVKIDKK